MLVNINTILDKFVIKYIDLFSLNKNDVKKIIKRSASEPDWRCSSLKELLSLRENQIQCELDQTEVNEMLLYISTYR